MIHTRVRSVVVTAAVAAVVGLAGSGCGNNDDLGSTPPVRDDGTPTRSGAAAGTATDDAAEEPAAGGGVPSVSRSTEIEAAEGVAGTLEIGLAGLEVDGQLVTLTLVYTPRYDSDPNGAISLFDMFGRNVAEVTLVDSVNLLRYLVVEDSRGLELGPFPATVETLNNEPVSASYTFAAPPADVESVDVYVDDRRIFDDVDVTR